MCCWDQVNATVRLFGQECWRACSARPSLPETTVMVMCLQADANGWAGLSTLQEDDQHPERLLGVFVEYKQQERRDVVHALAVADDRVVGCIGPQCHCQGLLAMALLEVRMLRECPGYIQLNLLDVSFVVCVGYW